MAHELTDTKPLGVGDPTVSIIIPCYNVAECVSRTLDDALATTGTDVEIIAVNDGSIDSTIDVLSRYSELIRVVDRPNGGVGAARNHGLAHARGTYVFFLDADDRIEPRLPAAALAAAGSGADVVFGPVVTTFDDMTENYYAPPPATGVEELARHIFETSLVGCAALWRAEFFREIGGWREDLRKNEDFELTIRALSHRPRMATWSGDGTNLLYYQTSRPGRISTTVNDATMASQLEVARLCAGHLVRMGLAREDTHRLVQVYAYSLWLEAARAGNSLWESRSRALYSEFGGTGHRGSTAHRLIASIVGLRTKERLSRFARRLKRS